MDKCREEFEQYIRDQSAFTADFQIGCNGQYKSDLMHFMFVTWQHQQAKVEELQTLYTQQGINMLKMQKRVDAAQKLIDDWNCGGVHIFDLLDELEQALKGEG
ncbi:hypothetical protein [Acinetobacter baumannii]|uniref:hypothetical protein n=1 Tax=Acinetobacter baumannii TaxID=470 RepID=UPI000F412E25|nr:hypothetical protein EEW84_10470 [Acinetobacter baumannii]